MRFVRSRGDPPESADVDALRDAVAFEGVDLAVLFGSYASGEAGKLSDLDVAIRFERDVGGSRRRQPIDTLTVAIQEATGVEAVDIDAIGPEVGYQALAKGAVYGDASRSVAVSASFLLRSLDLEPVERRWREALDARLREGTFGGP